MQRSLAERVREYLEDNEVTLMPDDSEREVRTNTRWYSLDGSEPGHASDVAAALLDVAEGLRVRMESGSLRGTFYAWYDEQAGQLRCSLTSLPDLPFGAIISVESDPSAIVEQALNDPTPGFIDLTEAVDVPPDFTEDLATVHVWTAQV